jgi:hypothetical protein
MSLDPMPSARELRAMAAKRGVLPPNSPVAPSKRPKAPSVRPWHPYRSKWEADYAKYLHALTVTGRIRGWSYESERLPIGVGASYTPDFYVTPLRGRMEFHEVKGYRREAAMVRIRAAAKQYTQYRFVLVTKRDGQWIHTPIT